ncbi:MAG TPA: flagellar export chaperone FliS [Candidatus Limenecus avicola]|jgi:flagellar protein fliS|uniref:Flagellar export chaperone FliS n=1 Tax=Candidatus Limenecus avicola TaxID=2840847 RepID=A0A9D1MZR1_9CLOT|nr:hpt protein [Clostridium sp. CAG:306]DAB20681.1 MAG TPA: flagellar export chaperone FliS [Candidatus Gastranaerophilales bacterium HUM_21]HIU92286.1 flagellar export chaperone FliS [Candidatus Limenecus avicola]
MNPYLKQYRQTQIDTAPKEQILLMLYDGAVRFLNQAKAGFAEKNIEKIHNNIVKVQNIITEFESTLDMKTGGEFAQNLFALYEYINNQLLLANIKKREECLDEALKHMTELRDTWRQAVKQFKAAGHSLDENDMDHYNSRVSTSEPDDEDNEDDDKMGEYI